MQDTSECSILFVDDEDGILEILQHMFEGVVGTVLTANTPAKAIEIAKQNHIHLAVLDLKMPQMSGLALLKELRKIQPSLVCMFLSGHGDKLSVQEAMRLGVEDFIDKPFEDRVLMIQVKKALDKVYYETLLNEVLELFVLHYSKMDKHKYDKLAYDEKTKTLRAALGVARMKILKKKVAT